MSVPLLIVCPLPLEEFQNNFIVGTNRQFVAAGRVLE
jgi:hypothetical protein